MLQHVLTPFFGMRQKGIRKEISVCEDGAGLQEEGIGHDLVPIRCLSIDGRIWIETTLVRKVVFCLLE